MDKTAAPNPLRYMLYSARLDDGRGELKQLPAGRTGEDQFAMFKKHLDRKGWAKRVSIKLADEPIGFDWWWNKCTEAPRKAGLPIMTAFNSIDYKEAEKGIGWVSPWQVLYMQHNQEFFDRAKKAGDLVSWYNCGPPPMINIGAKASELRGYLWQAAKADLDLISWWGIQVWQGGHHEVWYNRYSHHNSVMYPEHPTKGPWQKKGKGWVDKAPLDSMRWELIREGMEDARYVNLLRALIAQAREKGLKDAAGKAQAVLDGIWAEVFPTLNDYAPPYGKIVESREKIAAAVLELQAALKPAGKP
jgi:hypothetical protein